MPSDRCASLLVRLETWLKQHRKRYSSALLPGADPTSLNQLEACAGIPLPGDLRTFLAWHNGQDPDFPGRFEQDWRLMSAEEIAAAKVDLQTVPGWNPAWIPFLDDDSGDFLCLDTSQPNAPVRAFWQGQPDHPIVAPSLASWLEDFDSALEQGRYVEDPERGSFLRKSRE